jgi:NTP pyrophosphatase (non-canonical NTP hydrolase)
MSTYAGLQKQVDDWIREHTHGYFEPLMMMARLTEELGELSRAVSHRVGTKRPKPGEEPGDVASEIGDLLFVVICLANSMEIDLDVAWKGLLEKLYVRDVDRWKG